MKRSPGKAKNKVPGTTRRLSITNPEMGRSSEPFTALISGDSKKSESLGAILNTRLRFSVSRRLRRIGRGVKA